MLGFGCEGLITSEGADEVAEEEEEEEELESEVESESESSSLSLSLSDSLELELEDDASSSIGLAGLATGAAWITAEAGATAF